MTDNFDRFVVDQNKKHEAKDTDLKYYTSLGDGDYVDDDGNERQIDQQDNTFAKYKDGNFFIKVGLDNRAYNPIGMFSEGQYNKILSKIGKKEFNFKKVNKRVFELYLSFLRTKNLAWLNNTNRELS